MRKQKGKAREPQFQRQKDLPRSVKIEDNSDVLPPIGMVRESWDKLGPPPQLEEESDIQAALDEDRANRIALEPRSFREILLKDYMEPHGITQKQLKSAIPEWEGKYLFTSYEPVTFILFIDVALSLDRFFGFRDGHFIGIWAACATRDRARVEAAEFAKIKPVGCAAATTAACVARMRRASAARYQMSAETRRKLEASGHWIGSAEDFLSGKKLTTTHELADLAGIEIKKNARKKQNK